MAAITGVFTLYSLIHFSIYADGFLKTCRQYRLALQKMLPFSGTILPLIHDRLSCIAIFDFMDYIQPDSGNAYRDGFINTGADLTIGVIVSFFSWIIFLIITLINIKFARIKS